IEDRVRRSVGPRLRGRGGSNVGRSVAPAPPLAAPPTTNPAGDLAVRNAPPLAATYASNPGGDVAGRIAARGVAVRVTRVDANVGRTIIPRVPVRGRRVSATRCRNDDGRRRHPPPPPEHPID